MLVNMEFSSVHIDIFHSLVRHSSLVPWRTIPFNLTCKVKLYLFSWNNFDMCLICRVKLLCSGQGQDFIRKISIQRKLQVWNRYFLKLKPITEKLEVSMLEFMKISMLCANNQYICKLMLLDGARDNDWKCPKCGNVNFSFREVCNMRKCDTPKPGSQVESSFCFNAI